MTVFREEWHPYNPSSTAMTAAAAMGHHLADMSFSDRDKFLGLSGGTYLQTKGLDYDVGKDAQDVRVNMTR